MNDLDLCLEVVSRSRQPLRYIRRWISRKPLEIEAWFQRTTNRKWHMGYRMVTWPLTSRDLERSNSWPQYALSALWSRKLLELETSNLVCSFVWHTKQNITVTLFTVLLFCACCYFVVYICTWTLFALYARHYVFTLYVTVCECHIALKATWLDLYRGCLARAQIISLKVGVA